jgi:hypothetical protein
MGEKRVTIDPVGAEHAAAIHPSTHGITSRIKHAEAATPHNWGRKAATGRLFPPGSNPELTGGVLFKDNTRTLTW